MKLNLPKYEFQIKENEKNLEIYDCIRRKYVALTPEEQVRQNFVRFITEERGYPVNFMNNEFTINQNGIKRRCDTVVFDKYANPIMIIEYKAPHIHITQEVFNQIYRYNLVLKVKYLIVSNGIDAYCCIVDYEKNKCSFVNEIPNYMDL